jgi:hypothetical protein
MRYTQKAMKMGGFMKVNSMSEAVRIMFEKYPFDHEFGLWDLTRDIARVYPESNKMHGDTISRRLREFRYGGNYQIQCVNPNKSRYKKIKMLPAKAKA